MRGPIYCYQHCVVPGEIPQCFLATTIDKVGHVTVAALLKSFTCMSLQRISEITTRRIGSVLQTNLKIKPCYGLCSV